jgi:hypothetical protein
VGYIRYGQLPVYEEIHNLHERIHELGQEIFDLANHGMNAQVLSQVSELESMRDRFFKGIECLDDVDIQQPSIEGKVSSCG